MSSKAMSPTATLLRNSRLFSLPPPLQRPLNDLMGHVSSNRGSDTATLPYPVQQAVATTPTALGRGDWGLKRALPLRATTNTSTPLYRVNAVDTREHITDFESASDLTLTLEKFQELNLPVTVQAPKISATKSEARVSAFASFLDNTDPETPSLNAPPKDRNYRWKFHGPYTAGMNQGAFEAYVRKTVGRRRAEFRAWLKHDRLEALQTKARQIALREGKDPEEAAQNVQYSEEQFGIFLKDLRADPTLDSDLIKKIVAFLDLPPPPTLHTQNPYHNKGDDEEGLPRTHPSAGLSYLQSNAVLDNHPTLGPVAHRTPVEARVLVGTPDVQGGGKVGVAGIASNGPKSAQSRHPRILSTPESSMEGLSQSDRANLGRQKKGTTIGIDIDGGNRIWVEPSAVGITSRGRIDLDVKNSDQMAVEIHTGAVFERTATSTPRKTLQMPRLDSAYQRQSTGTGLEGNEPQRSPNTPVLEILREMEKGQGDR